MFDAREVLFFHQENQRKKAAAESAVTASADEAIHTAFILAGVQPALRQRYVPNNRNPITTQTIFIPSATTAIPEISGNLW